MNFETYRRRDVIRGVPDPRIGINRQGRFLFNAAVIRTFVKDFKATFLLYDKKRKVIGFKLTNEEGEDTFPFSGKGRTAVTVSGMAFLGYHGIPRGEKRTYKATWNEKEELVEIDLNKPL